MTGITQKIIPNLWFDREAEAAANLYVSTFKNSSISEVVRAGKAGFEIHQIPEGTVMTVEFELQGQRFIGINGGPLFKFNPSVSFLASCRTKAEVDAVWSKLSPGGSVLMELGEYPFSEWYGWTTDRYGLSWQVMSTGGAEIAQAPGSEIVSVYRRQAITPALLFVGAQCGRAEEAIRLYTSVFHNSAITNILRYGPGQAPDREGTIQHAGFTLEGQAFAAMDSALDHKFTFTEAHSFMVECQTQDEIDYYWAKLTEGGGDEGQCGWLKDKFGVSWQVSPAVLAEMLRDPDKAKVERVTNAFLKMKKFDLTALRQALRRWLITVTYERPSAARYSASISR